MKISEMTGDMLREEVRSLRARVAELEHDRGNLLCALQEIADRPDASGNHLCAQTAMAVKP